MLTFQFVDGHGGDPEVRKSSFPLLRCLLLKKNRKKEKQYWLVRETVILNTINYTITVLIPQF